MGKTTDTLVQPQVQTRLRPIVVNGKPVISVAECAVSAYFIRIWCKARYNDELYVVTGGVKKPDPLGLFDVVDLNLNPQFILERRC